MSKEYYAITTSMTFEKTVLVPKDAVNSLEEAIDIVDEAVESVDIMLFDEEADFKTEPSPWIADENGIAVLSKEDASCYQIIK